MKKLIAVFITLACVASAVSAGGKDMPVQQRPFRIMDHSAEETLGDVVCSPDGKAIAFTLRRSALSQKTNALEIPQVRDDVWLHEGPGKPVRNLTHGASDASGWWAPRWSPDGSRLAFLSSRGGLVTLSAWERATDRVRQLSREGADPTLDYRWLDENRILFLGMPSGQPATPMGDDGVHVGRGVEQTEAAWARAKRGELTANVVESLEFKLPQRRIFVLDVASGATRLLADTQIERFADTSWPSPDGQAIAFVQPAPAGYGHFARTTLGFPASVQLRFTDGRDVNLARPLPANIVTATLSWSVDGKELAFFALEDRVVHRDVVYPNLQYMSGPEGVRVGVDVRWPRADSREYPGRLWRVNVATGAVIQMSTADIDLGQGAVPPSFLWTRAGELLFHATLLSARASTEATPAQWFILDRGGRARPLSNGAKIPASLHALDGTAFLGLTDGDLWRVDSATGAVTNLTAGLEPRVQRFEVLETPGSRAFVQLMAGTAKNEVDKWRLWAGLSLEAFTDDHILNLSTGGITRLTKPVRKSLLVAYSPVSGTGVYSLDNRNGTFLWRQHERQEAESLLAANTWRRHVARFEERLIDYVGLNGEKLQAKLVLPHGFRADRRYPLIVDSDTDYLPDNTVPNFVLSEPDAWTERLFGDPRMAAGGYIYLWASMPTRSGMDETGRANLLMFTSGILPAVEKAVALGLADPDRVFLFGESSMGHGVFGLVTQTSRFKAAVAAAGWVDQVSQRLSLSMLDRYSDNPFDTTWMGARYSYVKLPFWRNADHMRRNSPLSYVDRVQTPLLILHGDLDFFPMSEPEMFFSALVQQRKPAQFVRYWGEGHGTITPANELDRHRRIFAWFDRWGGISRDAAGRFIWEGNRVKSRRDAPALKPEDYAKFDAFGPGGEEGTKQWLAKMKAKTTAD